MQAAMSDPAAQAQMMRFAEQMQQAVQSNPQLRALTKQLEGLDMEGGIAAAVEKLQENPALKEIARQLQGEGGAGMADIGRAMELGQKAVAQMLADPEQSAKLQQAMAQMMNPEAMAAMAEQFGSLLGGEGGEDMAEMMDRLGLGGRGRATDKDEDVFSANPWDNKDEDVFNANPWDNKDEM